jgi:hypothetical protein
MNATLVHTQDSFANVRSSGFPNLEFGMKTWLSQSGEGVEFTKENPAVLMLGIHWIW